MVVRVYDGSPGRTENDLKLQINSGTEENKNLYTFNGISNKTIDLVAGSNVTLTATTNKLVISSTDTNDNYYPTSFSWTTGTINGPTGSLTGVGMNSISIGSIPTATEISSGIITTGSQNIAGSKTFRNNIIGNLTGNADTATKLSVDRLINGLSFNNTTNIVIPEYSDKNLLDNGFIKFSKSGLILQWGKAEVLTDTSTVDLNITFPSKCFNIQLTQTKGINTSTNNIAVTAFTTSNFTIYTSSTERMTPLYWFAIGY